MRVKLDTEQAKKLEELKVIFGTDCNAKVFKKLLGMTKFF